MPDALATCAARPLAPDVDPLEVGFDADRLRRADALLDRHVAAGILPGWQLVVTRHGQVAHVSESGQRDLEAGLAVERDTLWRIYSMTKPVTSVAAMALWEAGAFSLDDPISEWIPAFGEMPVFVGGARESPRTVPATEPVRMWHLLTHTAGLPYPFRLAHAVDAMYHDAGYVWTTLPEQDIASCCEAWAEVPLLYQPGTEWHYSLATDVLGRVLECIAGKPLDVVLHEQVLGPLGMHDTAFSARGEERLRRLAALYSPDPDTGLAVRNDEAGEVATRVPRCLSGGGGLVSTAADYHRFTQMLLGGGAVDGVRVLGSRTVQMMTTNQLPGGADLQAFGRPVFRDTEFGGVGFGLGFSVIDDPRPGHYPASPGEFAWGGAASTIFWVDPLERMTVMFFTQLLPSSALPQLRGQLHQLVHQALVDTPPVARG